MICIPIREKSLSKVLAQIKKVGKKADLLEIWIDEIKDLDCGKIFKATKKPMIFKIVKRLDLVGEILDKVAYMDLDIKTEQKVLNQVKKSKTKLIISFHDFARTPSQKKLEEIVTKEFQKGADISKVATLAKSVEDNVKMLSLFTKFRNKKIIAICMGEKGKISRIGGLILGSYVNYASAEKGKETAKGQMTIEEIKQIKKWH
jgi:3-dehydroquinate dehydratase I